MAVALVITATPGMAEDVYERVRQLGESLSRSAAATRGSTSSAKTGLDRETTTVPPSRVTVAAVEGGARLVLDAQDPADAELLRQRVAGLLERMRAGGCPSLPPRPQPDRPKQPERAPSGHHH